MNRESCKLLESFMCMLVPILHSKMIRLRFRWSRQLRKFSNRFAVTEKKKVMFQKPNFITWKFRKKNWEHIWWKDIIAPLQVKSLPFSTGQTNHIFTQRFSKILIKHLWITELFLLNKIFKVILFLWNKWLFTYMTWTEMVCSTSTIFLVLSKIQTKAYLLIVSIRISKIFERRCKLKILVLIQLIIQKWMKLMI